MMGKTESHDFVYKKTYGLESHPELILTSMLSQADTPLIQEQGILFFLRFS